MQSIEILEVQDVADQINTALAPWAVWSEEITARVVALEEQNKRQGRKIATLELRVNQLETDVASSDTYRDTY